ncbi:MAG: hypothetical protein MRZ79_19645 [Bacteroidia bacterium]|nr:hypothetical protein [Bacteroidia bacterium]
MRVLLIILGVVLLISWFYTTSLIGVNPKTKAYYTELKKELKAKGYKTNIFTISGRRWQLDNWILSKFGGAASQSRHRKGEAIDIVVLDVNGDGKANSEDVDIVYKILNKKIIRGNGGIGTYKGESDFFSRQMVHFDCRGRRARWHR